MVITNIGGYINLFPKKLFRNFALKMCSNKFFLKHVLAYKRVDGITPRYGRQRERRWTPTRAKAQDTRASPNSLETHIVRK